MNTDNICYIAELDQDMDDVLAVEYLHAMVPNKLKSVVLSPFPSTPEGKQRLHKLEALFNKARTLGVSNVQLCKQIPQGTKIVFVGGPLTEVARYISNSASASIEMLVMNGGFVGCNIVPDEYVLDKFKNKEFVRTFNFNCDIKATEKVLKSGTGNIDSIVLVGKNVCHSDKNTPQGKIWRNDKVVQNICKRYNVRYNKKLHDVLACREGLQIIKDYSMNNCICHYELVYPVNKGIATNRTRYGDTYISGTMTQWGSILNEYSKYRAVHAAIYIKD